MDDQNQEKATITSLVDHANNLQSAKSISKDISIRSESFDSNSKVNTNNNKSQHTDDSDNKSESNNNESDESTTSKDKYNDNMSLNSGITRYTGVSSLGAVYRLDDPLVVIIGVSIYDGLPKLEGVVKDYENVIKTFVKQWKYNVLYKLDDNQDIYSSDISELNELDNYKLKWDMNEIEGFAELARKYVVKNKHNGLIFVISSHGDAQRIMYDSNCDEYDLDSIFNAFRPEWSSLLSTYDEMPQESARLFVIPKIFLLDMCRGSVKLKPFDMKEQENDEEEKINTTIQTNVNNSNNQNSPVNDNEVNVGAAKVVQPVQSSEKPKETVNDGDDNTNTDYNTLVVPFGNTTTTGTTTNSNNEKYSIKCVGKEKSKGISAQVSNFCKVYATAEGYSVLSGSLKGGIFLRSCCKVFKDKQFVSQHLWSELILKIREYTKRQATIIGNKNGLDIKFIQIVEEEGTMDYPIRFITNIPFFKYSAQGGFNVAYGASHNAPKLSKQLSQLSLLSLSGISGNIVDKNKNTNLEPVEEMDMNMEVEIETRKVTVTNLSHQESIAILVETEDSTDSRQQLLDKLADGVGDDFTKNGFVVIASGLGQSKFTKHYSDSVFITMFIIGTYTNNDTNNANNSISGVNKEIYDRREFRQDYLYFENGGLKGLIDVKPKCINNTKHFLTQTRVYNACTQCNISSQYTKYAFVCRKCEYEICEDCCHTIMLKNWGDGSYNHNDHEYKAEDDHIAEDLDIDYPLAHSTLMIDGDEEKHVDGSDDNNNHVNDNASVTSNLTYVTGLTGITGVSSLVAATTMDDPLIVIMGIAKFDELPNLDGVSKEYKIVIDTFVNCWKYKVFYQLNDNTCIYTNNTDEIKRNYKLRWDCDDIDLFAEKSRNCVIENKHNGLMFFISSHGDGSNVLYDSECEEYLVDYILALYSPQESNSLVSIPKIFWLDLNRVNLTETIKPITHKKIYKEISSTPQVQSDTNEKKIILRTPNETEIFQLKGIQKVDQDTNTFVQMPNFAKIYTNFEGYFTLPVENGSLLLRNICKVFMDDKYVLNHTFTEIVTKIREYTKRHATILSNIMNFTQMVEQEGTMEIVIRFGSKYLSTPRPQSSEPWLLTTDKTATIESRPDHDDNKTVNDNNESDFVDESFQKLQIANLSKTHKIAVLVEMEQNRENREEMNDLMKQYNNMNYKNITRNGFIIIDKNNGNHEFDKVWDQVYVTLFCLSNDPEKDHTMIYDGEKFVNNYLYFDENKLHQQNDKEIASYVECHAVSGQPHKLECMVHDHDQDETIIKYEQKSRDNNDDNDDNDRDITVTNTKSINNCKLCSSKAVLGDKTWHCKQCKHFLCQQCFHWIICHDSHNLSNVRGDVNQFRINSKLSYIPLQSEEKSTTTLIELGNQLKRVENIVSVNNANDQFSDDRNEKNSTENTLLMAAEISRLKKKIRNMKAVFGVFILLVAIAFILLLLLGA